jgi:hypothetical protein
MAVINWQVQRGLLVSDLTRQINRASRTVQNSRDPILDHIDVLQRFKRALQRVENEPGFDELVNQWNTVDQVQVEEL